MRLVLFVLFALLAQGETLDEAVRSLAKNIIAQLAPGEAVHVSERSLAPAFAAETTQARMLLDRALRRPAGRGATMVEVVVTATENLHGPLLVAEIERGQDTTIETSGYSPAAPERTSRPALLSRFVWEQDEPILDLVPTGDQGLLVLSPSGVRLCQRNQGQCEMKQALSLRGRDLRGRLVVSGDAFTPYVPDPNSGEFQIDGEAVHFSPYQNTLENSSGEKFFSLAHAGGSRLWAGIDGRIHVSAGQQAGAWIGWGSDLAGIANGCDTGPLVVATSPSDAYGDSVTAYEISSQNFRAASNPVPFPGLVTALWPAFGGALAVVHQSATGRYAAYNLTLDCSR